MKSKDKIFVKSGIWTHTFLENTKVTFVSSSAFTKADQSHLETWGPLCNEVP